MARAPTDGTPDGEGLLVDGDGTLSQLRADGARSTLGILFPDGR